MAKNRKLKPLKGGLNEPAQIPVTEAVPETVETEQPLVPVAVDHDGQVQPLEILGPASEEPVVEPALPVPRTGANAAQVMEQAASHEIDEITIMAMTDIFAEFGLEVVHDPAFNYLGQLEAKGGNPIYASDKAFSLARSEYLRRRQAMFDGMMQTNADSTTTMYCVVVGNAQLDPHINKEFLTLVHPSKHPDVLRAFPFLGEKSAEQMQPKVDVVVPAKTKPAKPAKPTDAAPQTKPQAEVKPQKEVREMKVKRSLLNAMFAAMKFKVPEKWPNATMLKHIKTLSKTVTEKELSLVKKADKELYVLLKALINLVEEGRAGSVEIVDDSKAAAKAAAKPAKPAKRSRDEDDDDEVEEEEEDDVEESDDDDVEDEEDDVADDDESEDESDDEEDEPEDEEEEEEEEEAPRRKKTKPAKKRPARDEDEDEEEEESDDEDEPEDDEDEDDEPRRSKKSSKPSKEKNVKKASKAEKKARPTNGGINLKAGKVLRRTYKDKEYVVKYNGSDFEYKGGKYTSLTAVAKKITGAASINGKAFFGVS